MALKTVPNWQPCEVKVKSSFFSIKEMLTLKEKGPCVVNMPFHCFFLILLFSAYKKRRKEKLGLKQGEIRAYACTVPALNS